MSLITYVTRVHFADRVLEDALPVEMARLGAAHPLLVTDAAGDLDDLPERVACALPPGMALRPAGDGAARGDAVIALGGSAALRAGRVLGARLRCPVIALPTTTADVGLAPIPDAPEAALPDVVLCDPTLTLAADAAATAAAGMDALVHCLEAYLGTTWNPPADGIALEGLRRARDWLAPAVAAGHDLAARREVLAAALNAGLAAQKGLGAVHALAHALEREAGPALRHGALHVALLPPVLSFNAPAVADRLAGVAEALRVPSGAPALTAALVALGRRIGLPARLDGLNLSAAALDRVACAAAEDAANRTNPRLAVAADYRRMLEAAL
jgi:alcohol dehydrogenase class IV